MITLSAVAALLFSMLAVPLSASASTAGGDEHPGAVTPVDRAAQGPDNPDLPMHTGPPRPQLTDLGVMGTDEAIARVTEEVQAQPGDGRRGSFTATYVQPISEAECQDLQELAPDLVPDDSACTGRYASLSLSMERVDHGLDESAGLVLSGDGGISPQTHMGTWMVTWTNEVCFALACWVWNNSHNGRSYFDGHHSWNGPHNGFNNGFHACGDSGGVGFTITPVQCWVTGDPSTWRTEHNDRFTVSFAWKGSPVSATHTAWFHLTPSGGTNDGVN